MAAPNFNKANRIIDAALDELKKRLSIVEPRFNRQLLEWLRKYDTSSGNLSKSERNKERVFKFQRAAERFLLKSGYFEMVDDFIVNFDRLQDNQQKFQLDFNGIKLTKTELNPFKRWAINETTQNLKKQGLNIGLLRPIQDEMFTSVNQGGSLKDMIDSLENVLVTTEQRGGLMKRLVTQASRDALGQYNGKVNESVRKTYKMDAILYVGSLVKDSRSQCRRWTGAGEFGVKGLLAFDDLQKEINWAFNNGQGMIPATTPETFTAFRGGYNCRHTAYPTRLENFR